MLQHEPQRGVGVGEGGDAVAEGLDVESAASDGNDGVVLEEEFVDAVYGILFVGVDVVGVGYWAAGNEVVGRGGEFGRGGASHADVEFAVELPRVARDDFGVQLLGQLDGMGCFACCCGAEYEFKRFDCRWVFGCRGRWAVAGRDGVRVQRLSASSCPRRLDGRWG